MSSHKVLLFNPRALKTKPRIPNSVLQVAASIEGKYDWVIVDGNMEVDPWEKIEKYLSAAKFKYFASTVMPGPQVKQSVPITKKVREHFPEVIIIWGGYFPSNHPKACIESSCVDYIVYGPGDKAFPQLLHNLDGGLPIDQINNLIFLKEGKMYKTPKDELYDQDELPVLPYEKLDAFYPMKKYLGKTFLGNRTIAYHSSVGCPFKCAFCGLVPIYEARWRSKSPQKIYDEIKFLKEKYGGDAIEFNDNNFFVSEKRVVEFCKLIAKEKMSWWGEGRIDTIDKFSDESLALMRDAGCKMIFLGAETGNDELLEVMDKGGMQSSAMLKSFAARLKKFDIIPEYSFILGMPAATEEKVMRQIDDDMKFIHEIKKINPATEIIIYVYSPVPTEGSQLQNDVHALGFQFPTTLEEWRSPQWEEFDMHRNPLTPWLKPYMVEKIKNFEAVINGYYPTISDIKLSMFERKTIRWISSWRYKLQFYSFAWEVRGLQKFWLRYRRPDWEGF
ncbi:MAG: B12-binding domain-containing radical SAM protein [Chitinophagales bacterium]|nr:B12-binding domain-containing radical SAM protein [Chitinophagales bacterium]